LKTVTSRKNVRQLSSSINPGEAHEKPDFTPVVPACVGKRFAERYQDLPNEPVWHPPISQAIPDNPE